MDYRNTNRNRYTNKKFWEELIAYFPLIRHGPHRKRKKSGRRYTSSKVVVWLGKLLLALASTVILGSQCRGNLTTLGAMKLLRQQCDLMRLSDTTRAAEKTKKLGKGTHRQKAIS
jgi:hypothetical protein